MERIVHPTERGQVTIPKNIREALHISADTPLVIRQEGTRIIIEPLSGLDRLTRKLEQEAKIRGISPEDLVAEVERVRQEFFDKRTDVKHE
ncbi:AbrB/MazE/SpoVT family DNA-binding domain-containing protein [Kyrpidia spormannii]|uniref:AbrB family transcriptional regulator n=2 Tax=Kyrpidia spormannii TaxID=2055160 RepID=A0ACA8Z8Q4_9BACL|nr:AbrB/MazE/SpoVT family DNA-binding domain-containing protein [Kyrpidia spormannii]CAB3391274.1 AbrB family transcriptional regulator [Kyrpidia spormannii]CAB3392185.1 AbrB family transcriptional regulator [Kyrpidia spormannii]HHY68167.1 AbrB/MazE/SpoVT family DNA-binding domain-containing protein [Alicyclobacillus sp.]